jgi:uncharacterized protein (TIGR00266 family)
MAAGETVRAEAGAMLAMSAGVAMETSTQGGVMKGLRRAVLGGESFFMNTFTAQVDGAELYVAPSLPGDVVAWPINGTLFVQSGSFLACSADIQVDTQWGGGKTFFSSEGLFMLRIAGQGELVLSSYGAIHAIDLQPGQTYTVDTGHMVAWTEGIQYNVRKVGNWKSTFFSGEGLVCDLTGPGRIYLQTRSQDAFLGWLIPKLPTQSGNSGSSSIF